MGRTVHLANWILLADGTQRGTLRSGGRALPAPQLTRRRVTTAEGIRLHPDKIDQLSVKWGEFTGEGARLVDGLRP